KNRGQHVRRRSGWQADRRTVTLTHGGVLLGKIGSLNNQIQPKYVAFFNSDSSTTCGYSSVSGSTPGTFELVVHNVDDLFQVLNDFVTPFASHEGFFIGEVKGVVAPGDSVIVQANGNDSLQFFTYDWVFNSGEIRIDQPGAFDIPFYQTFGPFAGLPANAPVVVLITLIN